MNDAWPHPDVFFAATVTGNRVARAFTESMASRAWGQGGRRIWTDVFL